MSRSLALVYFLCYCVAFPVIALRLLLSPGRVHLVQRFSFTLPRRSSASVWLHASSVGEVALLEPLVAEIEQTFPHLTLLITAFTSTGVATAMQRFPRHSVHPLPFDFGIAVRRYIRRVNPKLCVIVESEFWPRLLTELNAAQIAAVVVNAKMSERSTEAHLKTKFVSQALRGASLIAVQDEANAKRFVRLGLAESRLHVTGNMKFDLVTASLRTVTRAALGIAPDANVVVGGSLHENESEVFLDAVFVPDPVATQTVALIAPRYTETAAEVCSLARRRGLRAILKTDIDRQDQVAAFDVCVIDTFGELRSLYAIADAVFVGGSLFSRGASKGGHNLMEPAICGIPVLFGPFNYSFAQVARALELAGGGQTVHSGAALRAAFEMISADRDAAARMGEAARAVVLAGQGATARNVELIRPLLEQRSH